MLRLDGNKAGDQPVTVVLKALVRHQPPVSHLGLSDNRLTLKTMQVRTRVDATQRHATNTISCIGSLSHNIPPTLPGVVCESHRWAGRYRYKACDSQDAGLDQDMVELRFGSVDKNATRWIRPRKTHSLARIDRIRLSI